MAMWKNEKTAISNTMDESHKYNVEWKKPDKENKLYDSDMHTHASSFSLSFIV